MKTKLKQLCDSYQMKFLTDVPLSGHTTFHIGGNADYWIEINSVQGLGAVLGLCQEHQIPRFVMGRGSNILAADDGYRGVILHIGSAFSDISFTEEDTIVCQSGAMLSTVAKAAEEHHLSGMEALSGIPGTVGGALFMNAGAYKREMKDIACACTYLDKNGTEHTLSQNQLDLSYRHSFFTEHPDCIITSVTLKLRKDNPEEITSRMQDFSERRKSKQPLNFPSAGSTFKRPEGNYASKLIDECGLKGYQVGDAQVSEKHAGFVVNLNHATCAQVLRLCRDVHDKVLAETGYILELEPVLLGEQDGDASCS
ncbi:MAG: UDP-N-acetylmuramate dehydrogenase [Oscillospiraceae bacterium]|nr:UDP-N-acetylmuramate dehydrogenase [Oscillospiraceae bacterium]